jgi:hypothetical protein
LLARSYNFSTLANRRSVALCESNDASADSRPNVYHVQYVQHQHGNCEPGKTSLNISSRLLRTDFGVAATTTAEALETGASEKWSQH